MLLTLGLGAFYQRRLVEAFALDENRGGDIDGVIAGEDAENLGGAFA